MIVLLLQQRGQFRGACLITMHRMALPMLISQPFATINIPEIACTSGFGSSTHKTVKKPISLFLSSASNAKTACGNPHTNMYGLSGCLIAEVMLQSNLTPGAVPIAGHSLRLNRNGNFCCILAVIENHTNYLKQKSNI